ncbi:MAG: isoamylase early set domain-containing protein [Ignavibacteriales bacterium]|nr:isoamylase early set domain-containing protein [Ignavibacteriales bacterium]MCF8306674.1 isoamylase early set domain-containing protein [Ignavibacteriales bacterium]MCF8316226.1 isoamylase early set domain-containing protein [Ignavibacteriales bacterium]MCF8437810.1 isoamylase early set domain-containing protein [Ignavibacteriales bacterium]
MSLKKQFNKDKTKCKVTFRIGKDIAKDIDSASLVGDFNNWNATANEMNKLKKDGSFSIIIELDASKEYLFRYLLNGNVWINEPEADAQIPTPYGDSENSVIKL